MTVLSPARPLMLFDGACGFCRRWVERWRVQTGDRVRYRAFQRGRPRFISRRALREAVHVVAPEGVYRGAHAVFRALAEAPGGRWGLLAYRRVPLFAPAAESVYRFVARHRMLASRLTRLFIGPGPDVRPARYLFARRMFFVGLGLSSFAAFTSLAVQVRGLIGERGILPAADLLARVATTLGAGRVLDLPTVFWAGAGDGALLGVCVLGAALSLLVAAQLAWGPLLLAIWALYLSLLNVGSVFLAFQWDALLVEALLLAAFLAPWAPRRRLLGDEPSKLARLLALALLFKLHFLSGMVKLLSQAPTWRDLSALQYHYWTQPLPNPVAVWVDRLPSPLHSASALFMYGGELIAPFLLFGPRRVRHLGAGVIALLQLGIVATGNYGFFNALSLALCALAVDDRGWAWLLRRRETAAAPALPPPRGPGAKVRPVLAPALFALGVLPLFQTVAPQLVPSVLARAHGALAPFRSFNSYGLFAVMTTERQEIELEGSEDGGRWERYVFRYKPSLGDTTLPLSHLHMPRVDWQMWFAALGSCRGNPWLIQLQQRLLEGASPEVSRLFAHDPFRGRAPPRFLRTRTFDVRFRRGAEGEGVWRGVEGGPYCPTLLLEDGRLRALR